MLVRFALVVVALAVSGCHKQAEPAATRSSSSSEAPSKPVQRFGAAIGPVSQSTPIRDVLSAPERYQGRPLLVEGYVRRACSRKGCWMELAGGADPTLEGCRVTFKDYGFFVPTDSAGSSARVEAALELASLSPATVEHMEREGAKIPNKAADGSAREVRLVASGVELWR